MALAPHCRTARLALRPVAASYEAAVVAGIDDLEVSRWLSVVPHPYTPADFRHFQKTIAVPGETFLIEDGSASLASSRWWMASWATGCIPGRKGRAMPRRPGPASSPRILPAATRH